MPRDFVGRADSTIAVREPVLYVLHKSINNHYHWLAESLGRYRGKRGMYVCCVFGVFVSMCVLISVYFGSLSLSLFLSVSLSVWWSL